MSTVHTIPAGYGKAVTLKQGQHIKVMQKDHRFHQNDLVQQIIVYCNNSICKVLHGALQVMNPSGTQVVDTWAFNANDLKV